MSWDTPFKKPFLIYSRNLFELLVTRASLDPLRLILLIPCVPRWPWERRKDKDVQDCRNRDGRTCSHRGQRWFPSSRFPWEAHPKEWSQQKSTRINVWCHGPPYREEKSEGFWWWGEWWQTKKGTRSWKPCKKPTEHYTCWGEPRGNHQFVQECFVFYFFIISCVFIPNIPVCLHRAIRSWKVKAQKETKKKLEKAIRGLQPKHCFSFFVTWTNLPVTHICQGSKHWRTKLAMPARPSMPFQATRQDTWAACECHRMSLKFLWHSVTHSLVRELAIKSWEAFFDMVTMS